MNTVKQETCPACGVVQNVGNLRRHLATKHGYDESMIKEFNTSLRVKKGESLGTGSYKCSQCEYVCVSKSSMNNHIRKKHPSGTNADALLDPAEISLHNLPPEVPRPVYSKNILILLFIFC